MTSVRIEPIGIVFVNGSEQCKRMTRLCQKLLEKSDMGIVNVIGVSSSIEFEHLEVFVKSHIDILVVPIFCFQAIVDNVPKLFGADRLRYVWFDGIDEMCRMDDRQIHNITEILFTQELELQVKAHH